MISSVTELRAYRELTTISDWSKTGQFNTLRSAWQENVKNNLNVRHAQGRRK